MFFQPFQQLIIQSQQYHNNVSNPMQIKIPTLLTILILSINLHLIHTQQTDQQKRQRTYKEQLQVRDSIHMNYGQNSESVTFALPTMTDFLIKPTHNEQIKGVIHTFWKQNNVYISSEYREGENIRVLVYEESNQSPAIIIDRKFYITYGFKINVEKGKNYTIRFIDQGRMSKLVALELSKTAISVQGKISSEQIENSETRLANLFNQLKILSSISEFSIVMSEKNHNSLSQGTQKYFIYLAIEAIVILAMVGIQIKVLQGMLRENSVI